MAWTFELRWGSKTLDLNAAPFSVKEISVRLATPETIEHIPDFGAREVIRLLPTDRVINLRMQIDAASSIAVANALTDLKLLIDGPNQIAADLDQNPVYFAYDRTGGNGVMLHQVKLGNVNDGDTISHFRTEAVNNNAALNVMVDLIVPEAGISASTITLRNVLVGGDFSLFNSGTAVGWTLFGAGVLNADTTNYLVCGASQKIIASGAGQGISSTDIASVSNAAGYMWVYPISGTALVGLADITGGTALVQKTITAGDPLGNADMTAFDAAGNTWYRIPLSWEGGSTTIDIRAQSTNGAATFDVDAAYLTTAGTTVPNAWSSYSFTYNNHARTTSNPSYQMHIDIWGVPGDQPAYLEAKHTNVSAATGTAKRHVWSKYTEAKHEIQRLPYWVESDQLSYNTATGAWSDGTGTSDNHYKRFTEGAGAGGAYFVVGNSFFGSGATDNHTGEFWSVPRRIMAIVRCVDNTNPTITANGTALSVTTANTWELLDFGTFNRVGALHPDAEVIPAVITSSQPLYFDIDGLANTERLDVDAVLVPYAGDDGLLMASTADTQTSPYYMLGDDKKVYADVDLIYITYIGNCWYVAPGNRVTRLIIVERESDDEFVWNRYRETILTITPRSRLLLGKQTNL